ncbi:MAG: hypothetical protein JJ863_14005 [Deltaproteobacteria bacterium]|nr:hypothetical protein [Deltaproteobacteria bacterium]
MRLPPLSQLENASVTVPPASLSRQGEVLSSRQVPLEKQEPVHGPHWPPNSPLALQVIVCPLTHVSMAPTVSHGQPGTGVPAVQSVGIDAMPPSGPQLSTVAASLVPQSRGTGGPMSVTPDPRSPSPT